MKVVLIPGDGIGPEVSAAAQEVVAAAGVAIEWVTAHAGVDAAERFGDPLPEATLEAVRRYRVALKGPCTTPIGEGFRSINVRLRQGLDLFASVRPVRTLPGVTVPFDHVDLVVVRENTEGLYSGLEHVVVPGVIESLRIVTRAAAERIVRFAFELARREGRRRGGAGGSLPATGWPSGGSPPASSWSPPATSPRHTPSSSSRSVASTTSAWS